MSVTAYRPFMSVSVEEDGTGKAIRALGFAPTPQTERRLADFRLVFRPRDDGFQLYAQYNLEAGDVRLAPVTGRTPFHFGIWLAESDFLARYHPDLDPASGPCLYLANLDPDGSVRASGPLSRGATVETADAARIVARRLNAFADMTAAPKPTSIKVTDRYDPARTVATAAINAVTGSTTAAVAIDLSDDAAAGYTLAPQPGNDPKTALFADDDLAGRGAFGALELVAAPFPGADPAAGRKYTATFRKRS
ncbi:MAG: hypothetical protein GC201_15100 [Alphaproteobacteria bacterium]|nr:hypothetical protein [Alphaproteobacteria bacterium]